MGPDVFRAADLAAGHATGVLFERLLRCHLGLPAEGDKSPVPHIGRIKAGDWHPPPRPEMEVPTAAPCVLEGRAEGRGIEQGDPTGRRLGRREDMLKQCVTDNGRPGWDSGHRA